MAEPMIRLEGVTKQYPGQDKPAVEHIDLDIPEGEIVIFVGPSGCGKTTLMKMINRLIEPTSGRIFIQGEDVTGVNPDQLRRRIGYVIQQIGLFPHMTIGDNIATVPKMLGWDKALATTASPAWRRPTASASQARSPSSSWAWSTPRSTRATPASLARSSPPTAASPPSSSPC